MSDVTRFFVTGGTLTLDAPSYVERQADTTLLEGLCRGDFCYVLTPRQMGKSSLMVRTAAKLREQGTQVAILDLTMVGQLLTQEQWYYGLLLALGGQIGLRNPLKQFWLENSLLGPLQRWMAALREVVLPNLGQPGGPAGTRGALRAGASPENAEVAAEGHRLVIFVDEIDAVRSLPFSTDELFAAIRECYNRRPHDPEMNRLTFCLVGVATPSDLIQDPRTTPFNIGLRVELEDFTDTEAIPLTAGLVVGRAESLGRTPAEAREILRRILYWTAGHPYLTQQLCQAMVDTPTERGVPGVDRVCEELFLAPGARERDDNLILVRERLLRTGADLGGILELYSRVWQGQRVKDDALQPSIVTLRLSGIVKAVERRLVVRNRIYERAFDREWIRAVMPGGELRRQQAAYRQGMFRAAILLGAILVTLLASFLGFQQFKRAEQRGQALRESRYIADMGAAQTALRAGEPDHARALLDRYSPKQKDADLRGFEWHYLNSLSQREHHLLPTTLTTAPRLHFLPNSHTLVAANGFYRFEYLDTQSATRIRTIAEPEHLQKRARSNFYYFLKEPEFSADGNWITRCHGPTRKTPTGAATGSWTVEIAKPTGEAARTICRIEGYPNGSPVLSPDARLLAFCRSDVAGKNATSATLEVWDARSARRLSQLPLTEHWASSPVFSPDGTRLAVRVKGGTVLVWKVHAGGISPGPVKLAGHHPHVTCIAFSPDSQKVAVGTGADQGDVERPGLIKLWDLRTKSQVGDVGGHDASVRTMKFSPDGRLLISAGRDRSVRIWDVQRQVLLESLEQLPADAYALAVSPDSRQLVTALVSGPVRAHDLTHLHTNSAPRPAQEAVRAVQFLQDRKLNVPSRLPSGVYHLKHEGLVAYTHSSRPISKIRFSHLPDIRVAVSDRRLTLSDLRGHNPRTIPLAGNVTTPPTFLPDGSAVLVGCDDGSVISVDTRTQAAQAIHHLTSSVRSIAVSASGKDLAFLSSRGTLEVITASRPHPFVIRTSGATLPLKFSADGRLLTFREGNNLIVRDLRLHSETRIGGIPTATSFIVALCSDKRTIAVATSSERLVQLIQIQSGAPVATIRSLPAEPSSLDFNADGTRLAIGCTDGSIVVVPPVR